MGKRTYLLTVLTVKTGTAHGRITKTVEVLSTGEMHVVRSNETSLAVLFNSAEAFDSIGRSIESVTLSSDCFLLTEVGLRTRQFRLSRAAGWLKTHQQQPTL